MDPASSIRTSIADPFFCFCGPRFRDCYNRLKILGGRFDIFFSARGRGRGSPWRQEGGGGVCRNLVGGDAKYFFSGPKLPPRISSGPRRKTPFFCLWGILKVEIDFFKRG